MGPLGVLALLKECFESGCGTKKGRYVGFEGDGAAF